MKFPHVLPHRCMLPGGDHLWVVTRAIRSVHQVHFLGTSPPRRSLKASAASGRAGLLACWHAGNTPVRQRPRFNSKNDESTRQTRIAFMNSPTHSRSESSPSAAPPLDPLDTACCMFDRAVAALASGRLARTIRLSRQALRLLVAAEGPDHPDVANVLNTLGEALTERGDFSL